MRVPTDDILSNPTKIASIVDIHSKPGSFRIIAERTTAAAAVESLINAHTVVVNTNDFDLIRMGGERFWGGFGEADMMRSLFSKGSHHLSSVWSQKVLKK